VRDRPALRGNKGRCGVRASLVISEFPCEGGERRADSLHLLFDAAEGLGDAAGPAIAQGLGHCLGRIPEPAHGPASAAGVRLPPPATPAALSLTIAGTLSTYHVVLAVGAFTDETMQVGPMFPGPSLEIVIQGE
jgi:hypothetical protein